MPSRPLRTLASSWVSLSIAPSCICFPSISHYPFTISMQCPCNRPREILSLLWKLSKDLWELILGVSSNSDCDFSECNKPSDES